MNARQGSGVMPISATDTGSLVIDFGRLTSYGLTCLRSLCEHEATNNPDFNIARGFFEAARAIQAVKDGR